MKFRNSKATPSMEITLPNGMKIIATMSGYVEPGRETCDWAGINVAMVSPNGEYRQLCSAEYVVDDRKVRVFANHGRVNELDVSFEAPNSQWERGNAAPATGNLRLKMA
ncbi:MAG: hypothetical protein IJ089_13660 [Clostridia bacterium]|nr:hypothetical protein [Clostridia bacterium]MBQ8964811.1 hypothetical protein [Clostridia bacterium]